MINIFSKKTVIWWWVGVGSIKISKAYCPNCNEWGVGVTVLKNFLIKFCPNWAEGGRGNLNWDNVLKSASFFLGWRP